MSAVISLGIATMLTAIALALAALAFSLDYWTVTVVDRDSLRKQLISNKSLEDDPNTFTRNRGIFRECYSPFHEAKFLDTDESVTEGKCRPVDYELPENEQHLSWGSEYWSMIHLRRAHFAFFVLAMLLLVGGTLCGAVGCWTSHLSVLKATAVVVFLACFCIAAGMACFHGFDYMEKNLVKDVKVQPPMLAGLSEQMKLVTSGPAYSYSYGLGWSSMVVVLISAIINLYAVHQIDSDRENSEKKALAEQEDIHQRNRAYDMMDNNPYDDYPGYGAQPYPGYAKSGPYPGYEGYGDFFADPRY